MTSSRSLQRIAEDLGFVLEGDVYDNGGLEEFDAVGGQLGSIRLDALEGDFDTQGESHEVVNGSAVFVGGSDDIVLVVVELVLDGDA